MLEMLFGHIVANRDFYQLLHRRGLFSLVHQPIRQMLSFNPNDSNYTAYLSAFFSSGIYGWVEEWVNRGMQETAAEMVALIKAQEK